MSKTQTKLVAVRLLHAVTLLQDGKPKEATPGSTVQVPDDVAAEIVAAGAGVAAGREPAAESNTSGEGNGA